MDVCTLLSPAYKWDKTISLEKGGSCPKDARGINAQRRKVAFWKYMVLVSFGVDKIEIANFFRV